MKRIEVEDLKKCIGFGVAGNFAGHLEQAGEASDFKKVKVEDQRAPKGLFPFYLPSNRGRFVEIFPLSATRLSRPLEGGNLQLEPEVALWCHIHYRDGCVATLEPTYFGAYNDCSIRKPGARKISEKKNWGPDSKGLSSSLLKIDRFAPGGIMDSYRLACYLKRKGKVHEYGIDSPLVGYSYFYERLLSWIVGKMNSQRDEGPLEPISQYLEESGNPGYGLISIGATRYTNYGETTFLESGDEAFIVVYSEAHYELPDLRSRISDGTLESTGHMSVLRQTVF